MRFTHGTSVTAIAAIMTLTISATASAQTQRHFDIRAQDLGRALRAFGVASGREVVFADTLVAGKRSQRLAGDAPPEKAIQVLLHASGLHAENVNGAFVIKSDGWSQRNDPSGDNQELVVTGTRIRGSAPVGSPIVVVTRDALDKSGRSSMVDILQTIPQNFGGGQNEASQGVSDLNDAPDNGSFGTGINLRGLGDTSTLVLFDGIRPALAGANGSFSDISLIPSSAIDRIELLTDGASAIYGSDAVAGVVNFRFRNRFEGFETRLRSATADGDFGDYQLSQLAGKRWSNGGVMLAVEYTHRDALESRDRAFATSDLRPFGGPDNRSLQSTPSTITASNGAVFGIPAGQDGRSLTASQLIAGQQNRSDQQQMFDLLPRQTTVSAYASFDQELGHGIGVFARGLYARRTYLSYQSFYGQQNLTVPVTNPFYVDPIGTNQPVSVAYDLQRDFGREGTTGSVDAITGVGGLTAHACGWNFELSATYGSQISHANGVNIVNTARLRAALADPNPSTAFNVFGDGTANNPATIAALRGAYQARTHSQVFGQAARIDGAVLSLPAGDVKLALGAERRDEKLSYDLYVDHGSVPFKGTVEGLPGHRVVSAGYAELLVPVMSKDVASWFPGQLDLSLAGRIERYTDVGTTRNPKIGATWNLGNGLSMRGSYGTSFRAPFFRQLIGTLQNQYYTYTLPDPKSASGFTNVIALFGLPDHLGPEKARTLTYGVDYRPSYIPGLSATLTYFRIDYRDRIATAGFDLFNYLNRRDVYGGLVQDSPSAATVASYYANPQFFNPNNVAASSIGAIVNGQVMNLSRVVIRGIDFDMNYAHDLLGGHASFGVTGTRVLAIDQRVTPTATPLDVVGLFGSLVKLKGRATADWTRGPISIGGAVNYTAGYANQGVSYTNQGVAALAHVRSNTTFDAQIGLTIPSSRIRPQTRFLLSAVNLFDRDPPYVENTSSVSTIGYDPAQASPVGRTLSLQAIISW
jgi:iron complex outermembrane receptor protein